jgi:hypothetical protein
MLGSTMPWGSAPQYNAYGVNPSYNFKAEGDGTYGLSPLTSPNDNYWSGNSMFSQPTNYNQWANPFGALGGMASKAMGGAPMGAGGMNALSGFNMAGTFAGMSAINALDESKRREIDRYWYKLGDEESRRINARNYLGEGTLLDEAAGNLEDRRNTKNLRFGQFATALENSPINKFNNMPLAGRLNLNRPY